MRTVIVALLTVAGLSWLLRPRPSKDITLTEWRKRLNKIYTPKPKRDREVGFKP